MSKVVPLKGFGTGGVMLNFKVVKNPQPANPAPNTIWVNTDRKITSWIFSPSGPAEAEEGMVWVPVGMSSAVSFNALKKNRIELHPLSAYQYIAGTWVDLDAQIYQGGAWKDLMVWLCYGEKVNEDLTGGFVAEGIYSTNNDYGPIGSKVAPTVETGAGKIIVRQDGTASAAAGVWRTANKVSLKDISYLIFEGSWTAGNSFSGIYIWSEMGTYYGKNNVVASYLPEGSGNGKLSIDVSGLNESYYIGFGLREKGSSFEVESLTLKR